MSAKTQCIKDAKLVFIILINHESAYACALISCTWLWGTMGGFACAARPRGASCDVFVTLSMSRVAFLRGEEVFPPNTLGFIYAIQILFHGTHLKARSHACNRVGKAETRSVIKHLATA